jgi:hypothetical protein
MRYSIQACVAAHPSVGQTTATGDVLRELTLTGPTLYISFAAILYIRSAAIGGFGSISIVITVICCHAVTQLSLLTDEWLLFL